MAGWCQQSGATVKSRNFARRDEVSAKEPARLARGSLAWLRRRGNLDFCDPRLKLLVADATSRRAQTCKHAPRDAAFRRIGGVASDLQKRCDERLQAHQRRIRAFGPAQLPDQAVDLVLHAQFARIGGLLGTERARDVQPALQHRSRLDDRRHVAKRLENNSAINFSSRGRKPFFIA